EIVERLAAVLHPGNCRIQKVGGLGRSTGAWSPMAGPAAKLAEKHRRAASVRCGARLGGGGAAENDASNGRRRHKQDLDRRHRTPSVCSHLHRSWHMAAYGQARLRDDGWTAAHPRAI